MWGCCWCAGVWSLKNREAFIKCVGVSVAWEGRGGMELWDQGFQQGEQGGNGIFWRVRESTASWVGLELGGVLGFGLELVIARCEEFGKEQHGWRGSDARWWFGFMIYVVVSLFIFF